MFQRAYLEIDLDQLEKNFKAILERVYPAQVMAVVKANAYGLGVQTVAPLLKKAGASYLAVATVAEAEEIISCGLPIQILGNLMDEEITDAVRLDLITPAANFNNASKIADEAAKQQKKIRIAIPVDTGMGRLGMIADTAFDEIIKIYTELKNTEIFGIYSHLSSAWMHDDEYTSEQIKRMRKLYCKLNDAGIYIKHCYIAASNGMANYPETTQPPFNLVRSGISMYGFGNTTDLFVPPEIATFKSRLIAVRDLPEGAYIGYNRTYKLSSSSKVGTIAAGYADGIPLALSNAGYVLIKDRKAPVIGRVSMDYTTVLLDDIPDAVPGDEVVLFGSQYNEKISIEEWAELKKTHPHELLCSISNRVKRIYKQTVDKNVKNL